MLKQALVTGSATGIGRAIALDLAQQGFDVAFHYNRNQQAAKQAAQEAQTYGVKAITLQADITDSDRAQSLVDQAADRLGGLSVMINNVGNFLQRKTSEVSLEEWHEILNSNLNSTFYTTRTAIPYLKAAGGGRIINFACASAQNVLARNLDTPYMIAKTGIIIYTKSLAVELIPDQITANIIAPGVVENSVGLEGVIPRLPSKRPATLQEITNAVRFLIAPTADYITGQVLEVSGGWKL